MNIIQTPLNKTLEILRKDKSIRKYALIESLISLPFQILITFILGIIAATIFSETLPQYLNHPFVYVAGYTLVFLSIVSLPIIFYLQERFDIAAMYNAYDYLTNKEPDGFRKSKGKIWFLIKNVIHAKFLMLKLSFRRLDSGIKSGKNLYERKMYDEKFIVPLMLFENKSLEEAVEISANYHTRDFWKILKQEFRYVASFEGIGILVGIFVFLFLISIFPNIWGLFIALVLVFLVLGTFLILLTRFSRQVFSVVIYYYARKNLL